MEGADWLPTRLTSLHCAPCGRSYRDGQIRVRAQRDGLSFVDFVCRACGREATAIVTVVRRGRPARPEGGAGRGRILAYDGGAWQYEPRAFPILFNLGGDVVESFSPDFYLPELDLYVELTTLKQSLVRKKNRKLRRLRELYPGIRIKLFYAKDFKALLLKYGRFDLAGSLSGEEGQARPADEQLEDGRGPHAPPPPGGPRRAPPGAPPPWSRGGAPPPPPPRGGRHDRPRRLSH